MPTELRTTVRDGVVLVGDLHVATGDARRPGLLIRTPYGRQQYRDDSMVAKAVERGYAVVVQDVRGRYESAGAFDPYKHEGHDGFDTIEWMAAQPWSNGRVATAGLSYPGAVQWLAAVETPPHLVCAFPAMCFSSARHFFYVGGAFDLSWLPWTANNIAPDDRRRRNVSGPQTGREARAWWREHGRDALRRVPLRGHPLLAGVTPFYDEWLDHPDDGPYWDFAELERRHASVKVPVFNFSGWHDEGYGPIGATRNFAGLRANGGTPEARQPRLVVGPWVHGEPTPATRKVGDRDFGEAAGLDYDALVLDWCDLHARGIDRGLQSQPPVRLFVMGANRWRAETSWPVPSTPRTLYLRAGGGSDAGRPGGGRGARALRVRSERPGRGPALRRGARPARPARHRGPSGRAGVLDPATRRRSRGRRVDRVPALGGQLGAGHGFLLPAARRGSRRRGVEPDEPDARGRAREVPERRGGAGLPGPRAARGARVPARR